LPIHQIDEFFRNRQTQSRSLELSISLIINLIKFTKNMINFVCWNSDTRIFDGNMDIRLTIQLFDPNNTHHHMT
jgi:hypothetical protein